jgi:hypothetical protein
MKLDKFFSGSELTIIDVIIDRRPAPSKRYSTDPNITSPLRVEDDERLTAVAPRE